MAALTFGKFKTHRFEAIESEMSMYGPMPR